MKWLGSLQFRYPGKLFSDIMPISDQNQRSVNDFRGRVIAQRTFPKRFRLRNIADGSTTRSISRRKQSAANATAKSIKIFT
jgi:hypothetical protein